MGSYSDPTALWDLSQAQSFSQLPDDDFLALLQKQFPTTVQNSAMPNFLNPPASGVTVNPQSLDGDLDSDDGSPSPSGASNPHKRKATDDAADEEGPSTKNSKKGGANATKRKSGGGSEDTRLLKRKEQNRAAQRAFRERKEKHVKELEDKVSALEAKNEETTSENNNLRDLLSRLQNENMMLKQQQFTFQMPKNGADKPSPPAPQHKESSSSSASTSSTSGSSSSSNLTPFGNSPMFSFNSDSNSPFNTPSPPFSEEAMAGMNPLELSSYANLDPNAFSLFDDFSFPPSDTATSKAMDMDFGFNNHTEGDNSGEFISVASNPIFASMPSIFDTNPTDQSAAPPGGPLASGQHSAEKNVLPDFGMANSLSSWAVPSPPQGGASGTLDDLFGYPNAQQNDFSRNLFGNGSSPDAMHITQSNVSPVVHHALPNGLQQQMNGPSSNASSPSSHGSSPSLFSAASNHASPESDMSEPPSATGEQEHCQKRCPRTRTEYEAMAVKSGASPFAPSPTNPSLSPNTTQSSAANSPPANPFTTNLLASQQQMGPEALQNIRKLAGENMVVCQGTKFPKTDKSDKNIEVLTAWKNIRNDPRYKDTDINTLCSEFSAKAKCDGTKGPCSPEYLKNANGVDGMGAAPSGTHTLEPRVNGGLGPHLHGMAGNINGPFGANDSSMTMSTSPVSNNDPSTLASSTTHSPQQGINPVAFLL